MSIYVFSLLNGYELKLIDFNIADIDKEKTVENTIEKMKNAIVEMFGNKDFLVQCQNNSYVIAQEFANSHIEVKWLKLLNEYINCGNDVDGVVL